MSTSSLISKGWRGVGLLQHGDPRVLPQTVVQLAVAHVNRVHAQGTPLEETIGEPAGGSTDVQRDFLCNFQIETVESMGKFDAAAAYERQLFLDLEFHVIGECGTGFQDAARWGVDHPFHDQGLGLLPGFGQAPFD